MSTREQNEIQELLVTRADVFCPADENLFFSTQELICQVLPLAPLTWMFHTFSSCCFLHMWKANKAETQLSGHLCLKMAQEFKCNLVRLSLCGFRLLCVAKLCCSAGLWLTPLLCSDAFILLLPSAGKWFAALSHELFSFSSHSPLSIILKEADLGFIAQYNSVPELHLIPFVCFLRGETWALFPSTADKRTCLPSSWRVLLTCCAEMKGFLFFTMEIIFRSSTRLMLLCLPACFPRTHFLSLESTQQLIFSNYFSNPGDLDIVR